LSKRDSKIPKIPPGSMCLLLEEKENSCHKRYDFLKRKAIGLKVFLMKKQGREISVSFHSEFL
jgi:hypothetical protein